MANENGMSKAVTKYTSDQVAELKAFVNAITANAHDHLTRRRLIEQQSKMFEGKRDIRRALGYPEILDFDDFFAAFKREGLAKRIVQLSPNECWGTPPILIDGDSKTEFGENETAADETQFITDMKVIIKDQKLWKRLRQVDIQSRIGDYGVLFFGTTFPPDSMSADPLTTFLQEGSLNSPADILFLRAFNERQADITTRNVNIRSRLFDKPEFYTLRFESSGQTVHHSRIIHIAEDSLGDDIEGTPILEAAFDYLLQVRLVTGGASEAFWRMVFDKLVASIDKSVQFDADVVIPQLSEELLDLYNGFKSVFVTKGVDVTTLSGDPSDPTGTFDMLMGLVGGDIPLTILLGADSANHASSTVDAKLWGKFNMGRQRTYCQPDILDPVIQKLIFSGAVRAPTDNGGYKVKWPPLVELTPKEEAEIGLIDAQAQTVEWEGARVPTVKRWEQLFGKDAIADLLAARKEDDERGEGLLSQMGIES